MSGSQKTTEEIAIAAKQNAALYLTEIPSELDPARRLLQQYAGIAPENIDAHICEIRDKAWAVFPYGGIGSFKFLDMTSTVEDPMFQTVAKRLKAPGSSEVLLDMGCCLGHAVRQLIVEGVPSERLYGLDLQPRFLDFGYDLFCDRGKTKATYLSGDMLKDPDSKFEGLNGIIDIIYASAFFHLFERQDQIRTAKRMIGFLNPNNPDVIIFGQNGGPKVSGWEKYVLDERSWTEMWNEVGKETGTSWRTEMNLESGNDWTRAKFVVYRSS
ncbi:hypothetical protein F5Y16DRAFT_152903 [Xylariaceae sp. FL0255]|nr:hypothetical protein F5Y16DRAFT_152903 [Xylariaceae sp. FL0255]